MTLLYKDQFCDYIGEEIVSPVRELCSQSLSICFQLLQKFNLTQEFSILKCEFFDKASVIFQTFSAINWHAKYGTLLLIKYLIPLFQSYKVNFELKDQLLLWSWLKSCILDANEDVSSLACKLLSFVISRDKDVSINFVNEVFESIVSKIDTFVFDQSVEPATAIFAQHFTKNLYILLISIFVAHPSFLTRLVEQRNLEKVNCRILEMIITSLFLNYSLSSASFQCNALTLFLLIRQRQMESNHLDQTLIFQDIILIFVKILISGNVAELTILLLKIWNVVICHEEDKTIINGLKERGCDIETYINNWLRLFSFMFSLLCYPVNTSFLAAITENINSSGFKFQPFVNVFFRDLVLTSSKEYFTIGGGYNESLTSEIRFIGSKCLASLFVKILRMITKLCVTNCHVTDFNNDNNKLALIFTNFDENFKLSLQYNGSCLQKSMQLLFIYHFLLIQTTSSYYKLGGDYYKEGCNLKFFNFIEDSSYINLFKWLSIQDNRYDDLNNFFGDMKAYGDRFLENLKLFSTTREFTAGKCLGGSVPESVRSKIHERIAKSQNTSTHHTTAKPDINNNNNVIIDDIIDPEILTWFAQQTTFSSQESFLNTQEGGAENLSADIKESQIYTTTTSTAIKTPTVLSNKKRRCLVKIKNQTTASFHHTEREKGLMNCCIDGAKVLQQLNTTLMRSHLELNCRVKGLSASITLIIMYLKSFPQTSSSIITSKNAQTSSLAATSTVTQQDANQSNSQGNINLVKSMMAEIKHDSSFSTFQAKTSTDLLYLTLLKSKVTPLQQIRLGSISEDPTLTCSIPAKWLVTDQAISKMFERLVYHYLPAHNSNASAQQRRMGQETAGSSNVVTAEVTFVDYLMPIHNQIFYDKKYPSTFTLLFTEIFDTNFENSCYYLNNLVSALAHEDGDDTHNYFLHSFFTEFSLRSLLDISSTNNKPPKSFSYDPSKAILLQTLPLEYIGSRYFLQSIYRLIPLPHIRTSLKAFWSKYNHVSVLSRTLYFVIRISGYDWEEFSKNCLGDDLSVIVEQSFKSCPSLMETYDIKDESNCKDDLIRHIVIDLHVVEITLPQLIISLPPLPKQHVQSDFNLPITIRILSLILIRSTNPLIRFSCAKLFSSLLRSQAMAENMAESMFLEFSYNALSILAVEEEKIHSLLGILEGLTHILVALETNHYFSCILPYCILFVIPCIGLLTHSNEYVRKGASHCFITIFPYLSLNNIYSQSNPFENSSRSLENEPPLNVKNKFILLRAYREGITFLETLFSSNSFHTKSPRDTESSLGILNVSNIHDYLKDLKDEVTLRNYQIQGVSWVTFLQKYKLHGILCDDMGLGKTLQAICGLTLPTTTFRDNNNNNRDDFNNDLSASEGTKLKTSPKISIVICPHTVIYHWVDEFTKFLKPLSGITTIPITCMDDLNIISEIPDGFKPEEEDQNCTEFSNFFVFITSYDIIRKGVRQVIDCAQTFSQKILTQKNEEDGKEAKASSGPSDNNFHFHYCILDEGHLIRNPKAKITKAVKVIKANYRLILSGTPFHNHMLDLWSLFDFLMPGYLGTEKDFINDYDKPVSVLKNARGAAPNVHHEQEAALRAIERLHKLVLPFILRRTKDQVLKDLPPKIIQDCYCEMTDLQKEIMHHEYLCEENSENESETLETNTPINTDTKKAGRNNALKTLHYSRMVCNHPGFALNRLLNSSEKFITCKDSSDKYAKVRASLLSYVLKMDDLKQRRKSFSIIPTAAVPVESINMTDLDLINYTLKDWTLSGKMHSLIQLLKDFCIIQHDDIVTEETEFINENHDIYYNDEATSSCRKKALIFFQTTDALRMVKYHLKEYRVPLATLTGSMSAEDRHNIVNAFNETNSLPINSVGFKKATGQNNLRLLLLTTKVGGLGLNLTAADTVIFYEHDWNPMNDLQAMDRAHRIGQKKTVNVYRLITKDTLEEKIMNLQKFKLSIANSIVNTENSNYQTVRNSTGGSLTEQFSAKSSSNYNMKTTTSSINNKKTMAPKKGFKALINDLQELWGDETYPKHDEYEEFNIESLLK